MYTKCKYAILLSIFDVMKYWFPRVSETAKEKRSHQGKIVRGLNKQKSALH